MNIHVDNYLCRNGWCVVIFAVKPLLSYFEFINKNNKNTGKKVICKRFPWLFFLVISSFNEHFSQTPYNDVTHPYENI